MIDRDAFRHVRPLDLARALGLKVAPRPGRDRCRVLCPWHNERTPSLALAAKAHGVAVVCRSCQAKGDHFALAAVVWGLDPVRDFRQVALRLADALGLADVDRPEPASSKRRGPPADPLLVTAYALEAAADAYLDGRSARDADLDVIEAAGRGRCGEALAILESLPPPPVPSEDEQREAEFERMADQWAQWGWTHRALVPGHETDWAGVEADMRKAERGRGL